MAARCLPARLALELGRDVIIDIGGGHAGKLALLQHAQPDWHYVSVDYGPNIHWCRAHRPFGNWIEADLETRTALAIPAVRLRRAVIVCSDVLEHLVRPDIAMHMMLSLAVDGGNAPVVLSTPARERRSGAGYPGQPRNPAHVREWTSSEFQSFVTSSGFVIRGARLTHSDDQSNGLTTQLVTAYPG